MKEEEEEEQEEEEEEEEEEEAFCKNTKIKDELFLCFSLLSGEKITWHP